jgi:hypothetical protein
MGEIADSMLSGEMCAACGEWLECMISDDDIEDPCSDMCIPMYCSEACAKAQGADNSQVCKH